MLFGKKKRVRKETTPAQPVKPVLTVGGSADGFPLEAWPHFNEMPLAYLAKVVSGSVTYFIFLDGPANEMLDSWQVENGSNAVIALVDGSFKAPEWITLAPVEKPVERLATTYRVPVNDEPKWLQGDESQDGFTFAGQIDSDLDADLNVGDAHGVAYVFIKDSDHTARLLWQA